MKLKTALEVFLNSVKQVSRRLNQQQASKKFQGPNRSPHAETKSPKLNQKIAGKAKGSTNTDSATFNRPRRELDQDRSHS